MHGPVFRLPQTLRSATLEGQGYIELPSPLLRRKAALGLSFAARAPSGLLLLRAPAANSQRRDNEVDDDDDSDDRHYLAIVMIDGKFCFIFFCRPTKTNELLIQKLRRAWLINNPFLGNEINYHLDFNRRVGSDSGGRQG